MSANTILFKRGSRNASDSEHYGGVENNEWDDTTLNSAYDTAMKIAKAEVAKRVAMSTNSQPENRDDKKPAKGKQPTASSSKTKKEWKAGMACRAVYVEDGLEYEAFVLRVLDDQNCVIRFLGYENCEMVSIDDLMPSQGKNERKKQIEQATLEKEDYSDLELREGKREKVSGGKGGRKQNDQSCEDGQPDLEWRECGSDRVPSPGSTESYGSKQKSPKKKKSQKPAHFDLPEMPFPMPSMPMRSMMANLGSMDMPLPPPPIALPQDRTDPEEQAVSSMLMSWYMSGYYTGLYQGMKRAKQGRKRV